MYPVFYFMWSSEDIHYMEMAVDLAGRGEGQVSPNPMVGAVIVKDGRVISEGWHRAYGGLHAETDALASCTESPAGATMYVTLEPCCHYGKQPPCTSAIINSGISRVVVGMTDPNPLVSGKGISILRSHGLDAETGLLENRIKYLNRVFIKYITTRMPWVVLKSAMTLDGRIASAVGDSRWVSCAESRHFAHILRGRYMGIMAGAGTVLADDPMLNCRIAGMRQPVRIVVCSRASLPETSAVVRTAGEYRTLLAYTPEACRDRLQALQELGIETLECSATGDGRVDMRDLFRKLGETGVDSVLVEGGGEINGSIMEGRMADEYYMFVAPKIIGGRSAKGPVGGNGFKTMQEAEEIDIRSVTPSGCDWLIHGFAKKYGFGAKCLQE